MGHSMLEKLRKQPCRIAGLALVILMTGGFVLSQDLVTFETLTVDATVGGVGLATATIKPSGQPQMTGCTGRVATAQIRYRYDGTAPTSTVGTLLEIGDTLTLEGLPYLVAWRGIRTGATSGVMSWHCYIVKHF